MLVDHIPVEQHGEKQTAENAVRFRGFFQAQEIVIDGSAFRSSIESLKHWRKWVGRAPQMAPTISAPLSYIPTSAAILSKPK